MHGITGRVAPQEEDGDVAEFWFNTTTHQVDEGHRAPASNLLGPYATRGEAEQALALARQRTEAWDREDADD